MRILHYLFCIVVLIKINNAAECNNWYITCGCRRYTGTLVPICRSLKFQETEISVFNSTYINSRDYSFVDLSLNNTKLIKIEDNSFEPYRMLKTFSASGNNLTEITDNTFNHLEKTLRNLDISNNKIREISKNCIKKLILLEILRLDSNKIEQLTKEMIPLNLTRLNVSNNEIYILEFEVQHNLVELDISKNYLQALQNGIFPFKKLRYLDASRNYLTNIESQVFNNLTNIESITLSFNDLNTIHKNTFSSLPHLHTLNLSYNHIHLIEKNALFNLSSLTRLSLASNKIVQLDSSIFGTVSSLNYLYLSNNKIEEMDTNFYQNTTLEYLDLSYNYITELKKPSFSSSLKYLNISNNRINVLKPNVLNLPKIESIELHVNNLKRLETNILNSLDNLKNINISYNLISSIDTAAFNNLQIENLDLNHNKLTTFDAKIFSLVKNVTNLNVSFNEIETISGNYENIFIKSLDLSFNKLENINGLQSFKSLYYLNITHNVIRTLTKDIFDNNLITLRQLYLAHNFIEEIPQACFGHLNLLFILDLSFNKLKYLNISNTIGLSSLGLLNLSSNNIAHVSSHALHTLISLFKLDLSNNFLTELNLADTKLSGYAVIDINGNKFKCNELSNIIAIVNKISIRLSPGTERNNISIKGIYCEDRDETGVLERSNEKETLEKLLENIKKNTSTTANMIMVIAALFIILESIHLLKCLAKKRRTSNANFSVASDLQSML